MRAQTGGAVRNDSRRLDRIFCFYCGVLVRRKISEEFMTHNVLTPQQFQRKLDALQELFEIDLEGLQRIIFQIQKDGRTPYAIWVPPIEILGLPLYVTDKTDKPRIMAQDGISSPTLGTPEKSS